MSHTPGPWKTEAVSDAVRVIVGTGRKKVILARLSPKQLPESETHANARLMAAAPDLLNSLRETREAAAAFMRAVRDAGVIDQVMAHLNHTWDGFGKRVDAALNKAEGL